MKSSSKIILILAALIFCCVPASRGRAVAEDYPRLGNYFLNWSINMREAEELARWDLLVLDMELQVNSKEELKKIRKLNPNIIILAYITSQEINHQVASYDLAKMRQKLIAGIDERWWLKSQEQKKTSFWPSTWLINITDYSPQDAHGRRWNTYLPEFVKNEILATGLWDGVFYDNLWPEISWTNGGNIDIDLDGEKDGAKKIDNAWKAGAKKILNATRRDVARDFIMIGNGTSYDDFQTHLNGFMFESFPSEWESGGDWAKSIKTYLSIGRLNVEPKIYLMNVHDKNRYNFSKMRYGLASSLMGEGHYSFDYDPTDHGQLWWYDEYDVSLGKALSGPVNLLDKNNKEIANGLWRRDFENAIAIVNSTDIPQRYIFYNEEFEKINGLQDTEVNDGSLVNYVTLNPSDGIILQKRYNQIRNSSFSNGSFVRVFDEHGNRIRNGFFAYTPEYPGGSQVMIVDLDNDGSDETIVNYGGQVTVYKKGVRYSQFFPYDEAFRGGLTFAVGDLNNDGTKEIITAPGKGGGPHVRIFDINGRPLIGGFFAYDKSFRGGVNVACMDLNGDGIKEIITGAGPGGGPHVRVFSKDGNPLTGGFFAYDKSFRGGVSVAAGDLNGDGIKEIITGAGPGGGPHVKVYSKDGEMLTEFFAYDKSVTAGITVMSDDTNNDGKSELLVGIISF